MSACYIADFLGPQDCKSKKTDIIVNVSMAMIGIMWKLDNKVQWKKGISSPWGLAENMQSEKIRNFKWKLM